METKGEKSNAGDLPQTREKHPTEWAADLSPNHMAGQNVGERASEMEMALPTAYDVKDAHRALADRFADDELRQIPILPSGERLQQGATYIDLHDSERQEFTAMGGMAADEAHWYVPKDRVPYPLWNRLIGVENPARRNEGTDRLGTE